jgi:putative hydroxymethylpyrimidine transport system ATP-binding protein
MFAPSISITNARLSYQNHILFDRLSFYLPAGQTTCLLGPSGIGKSSFLQLIAGLHNKANAIITAGDQRGLSGRISYMTQANSLVPWLNTLNNALLGFRIRGVKLPIQSAKELLVQLGLGKDFNKYPAQLSGGMQQRVALARLLLDNKPILLMDEPFSCLDSITRHQLQSLSARLLNKRTVLLITHDPLEALRLGHHIAIMSGNPAKIEPLKLEFNHPPPRSLHDIYLLEWQNKLLNHLAEIT